MSVRLDKWLWAVRAYKTRSAANDACRGGRVTINGDIAKPASKIAPGDRVVARRRDRTIDVEVVELLEKRVGAARAAEAVVDHSPPPEPRRSQSGGAAFGQRDRGSGRPTKRERRQLDRFRSGD